MIRSYRSSFFSKERDIQGDSVRDEEHSISPEVTYNNSVNEIIHPLLFQQLLLQDHYTL